MCEAGAADEAAGAMVDGVGYEGFEAREACGGDHGAHVCGVGVVEGGAGAEGADAGFKDADERCVGFWEGDDAFDADAILARGLEDAAHEDTRNFCLQTFNVVEYDSRIFAAEFDEYRSQGLGGGSADGVGNGSRADEGDMGDTGVGSEVICCGGPADERLDEVGGVAAGGEGGADDRSGVGEGPGGLFRRFNEEGRAGEEG